MKIDIAKEIKTFALMVLLVCVFVIVVTYPSMTLFMINRFDLIQQCQDAVIQDLSDKAEICSSNVDYGAMYDAVNWIIWLVIVGMFAFLAYVFAGAFPRIKTMLKA